MIRKLTYVVGSIALVLAGLNVFPQTRSLVGQFVNAAAPPPMSESNLVTGTLTSSYAMTFTQIEAPFDNGAGGAIAALGDTILVATRLGGLYRLNGGGDAFVETGVALPSGGERLSALMKRPVQRLSPGVKDLILREAEGGLELTISYVDLARSGDCVELVIVRTVVAREMLSEGGTPVWKDVYRSTPCVSTNIAFNLQVGGAMAYAPDGTLYVFVGDFGIDGFNRELASASPQNPDAHMGKVVAISPGGTAEVVSLGHRNPGGLTVTRDGRVFVTEHGPRGGDELNLIEPGANYGWPLETYGANYGELVWPPDLTPGTHERFAKPMLAWVPSIAVSSVAELQGEEFGLWDGDLVVATLKDESLHRLRLREGRVILDEPIRVGGRIRDIAIDGDGRILVKLDNDPVVLAVSNADATDRNVPRGLAQCAGCHQTDPSDGATYSGPTLVGVLGRKIGSVPGYDYSRDLASMRGTWDPNKLAAFLEDPASVAPGSTMPPIDVGPIDIRAVLAALRTLPET